MDYYSARVRLQGSPLLEVWKHDVPAPELMLLNAIHGGNAVAQHTRTNTRDFTAADHRALRATLTEQYGTKQKILDAFHGLFGMGKAVPLPETVTEQDLGLNAPEEVEDDAPAPAPAAQAAPPPAKAVEVDPREAIRDSLTKLGAPLPKQNASLEDHRAALQVAQKRFAAVELSE